MRFRAFSHQPILFRRQARQGFIKAQGSTLNAGRNISITTTGKNKGDESGDISIVGSQLKAGGNISLDAARDIALQSAKSTEQTDSKNSSKGGTVGIGIGVGSGGYGISVSASANSSKGNQTGNSLSHNETTLDAGNAVNITSGRDTTLKGAQVSGESITADVGRNLTLQSEQDSDRYDSKQQSASAGGSFTFGSMTGSVNANVSRDNIHSNFDSVKEQTGLFAGQGGYNITVGNHTQLDGAVISSTADKDKNLLDTGTLGWTDIHNEADYKSEHQSAGFNSGGPIGANLLSNVGALPISGAGSSGHAEGTTKSAISEGGLVIRNKDVQSQSLTGLSRDTEHANDGAVNPIFDKEKEQKRLQQAQAVSDIASQALDIYNTYEATKATRAATASILDPQLKAGYEGKAIAELAKAKALNPDTDVSPTAVINKAWQLAYDSALSQQGANMGGSVRVGVNAVVNALQALAGGDIKAALAQGAAPYLAAKVKEMTTGNADYSTLTEAQKLNNLMAHAILGGVIAELSGGNAVSGASGAMTGELAAPAIALAFYGTADSDKLTSSEKENVSALATLVSGIAAGMASDSASGAVTGAQAGKNAVENNALAGDKARESVKESTEYWKEKVRKAMGENTASQLTNGLLNLVSGTGDGAILAADTVFDVTAALAACATENPYCTQAKEDLAKKDKAASQTLNSLINGNAWNNVKNGAIKAAQGDQQALENLAGIITGALIPGKIVSSGGKAGGEAGTVSKGSKPSAESVEADTAKNIQLSTGTVFDSIKATQPVHPGSVIPQSFEMLLPNGQKIWVHGNATEHMAEYAASKAVTHTPETVRLASQEELRSFQAAVNTATKNRMPYGERITVDGWQLEIKPPRAAGELPTIIHARYTGSK